MLLPSDLSAPAGSLAFLLFALLVAFGFEFINGFHDTSNAVATVIYTRALQPWIAVVLSGVCNFFGVFLGGMAVALSITHLLPTDLLVSEKSSIVLALIMALLIAAILWNLGTWYVGIPVSSSHTLIGSILGAGLAYSLLPGHVFGSGINWGKAIEVLLSLLISPFLGFFLSYLLLKLSKVLLRDPRFHKPPVKNKPPPFWMRCLLIGTCSGVSLAHGSNDGQKGIGLLMIILIGFLPANFALNRHHDAKTFRDCEAATVEMRAILDLPGEDASTTLLDVKFDLAELQRDLQNKNHVREISPDERMRIRRRIVSIDQTLAKMEKQHPLITEKNWEKLRQDRATLLALTDYAPQWVLLLTALSLGIGTMIGWKRIVVTVGEKIGQQHLTCAQGAAAQLVAMITIGLSSVFGMPVSTTHVLSSGISGAMVAQPAGLQLPTIKKIASAWILTLPVSMLLSGVLFLVFWLLFC